MKRTAQILLLWTFLCLGAALSAIAGDAVIWGTSGYGRLLPLTGLELSSSAGLKQYRSLTVNPSAGAGVVAPIGSIGVRDNGGAGEVWVKVAAGNTAWSNALTAGSGWSLLGNAGTNPAVNFLGTTDAQDLVLRTNSTERFRITSAGVLDTTLGTGLLHSDASGLLTSSLLVNADVAAAGVANIARDKLAAGTANHVLINDGAGVVSSEAQLTMSRGGTNKNMTASNGAVAYSDADSLELSAVGTAGQALLSAGAAAPIWSTIGSANTIWVSKTGNDASCIAGNIARPCLTIGAANALVTAPATANRWLIKVGAGTFTEDVDIIPYTWYVGEVRGTSRISDADNITPTAAWGTATARSGMSNLYLTGTTGINFDLQALGGAFSGVLELDGVFMNGDATFLGRWTNDSFEPKDGSLLLGNITISCTSAQIQNVYVVGNLTINTAGAAANTSVLIMNTVIGGNTTVSSDGADTNDTNIVHSNTMGTLTVSGAGTTLGADAVSIPATVVNPSGVLTRLSEAFAIAYVPTTPANWTPTVPDDVREALDLLAAGSFAALSNYLYKPGLAGGQTATGGTAASNNLVLRSTTNGTKGQVYLDETTASTSPTTGALRIDGGVGVGGQLTAGGALRSSTSLILEDPGAGTNTVTLVSPATPTTHSVTLPTTVCAAGEVWTDNGAGVMSCASNNGTPQLFGTRQTGRSVVAGTGITSGASHMSTTAPSQLIFIVSSTGSPNTITANPSIEAGTIVGQKIRLCGTSDTASVQINNGNGIAGNGSREFGKDDCCEYTWLGSDGTTSDWAEQSCNF